MNKNLFHKYLKCGILLIASEDYMYSFAIGKSCRYLRQPLQKKLKWLQKVRKRMYNKNILKL